MDIIRGYGFSNILGYIRINSGDNEIFITTNTRLKPKSFKQLIIDESIKLLD